MKTYDIPKLDRIIKRYKLLRQKNPDKHIDHCIGQQNLKDAIKVAAQAVDNNNKIHKHQRRIGRADLNTFADKLKIFDGQLSKATSFDEIFEIVNSVTSKDIGELTIYDTAFRIGCYLNIFPNKIYLHSGTRKGARNLLGRLNGKKYLLTNELPSSFQRTDLTPFEIEDILCIYKGEFANCEKKSN